MPLRATSTRFFFKFLLNQTDGDCRRHANRRVVSMPTSVDKPQIDAKPVSTTAFAAEEPISKQRVDQRCSKLRALLVEDEAADVELALRALAQGGFDATPDVVQTE